MTQAILLVGHGTRNPTGQQQFLRLAEHLRAAVAPLPLEFAYIELQTPSIEEALVRLHSQGLKNITLSPALLFAAGHAKQDIPEAVARAKQIVPDLEVTYAEPLGCHPALIELAAVRFHDSLASGDEKEPWSLVLIGRGSSDPTAIEHCQEFAIKLAARVGAAAVSTGFIAVARPSLDEALSQAGTQGLKHIVVQPHLLFDGEMLETTTAAVERKRQSQAAVVWHQAGHLGSDLLEFKGVSARYLTLALVSKLRALGTSIPNQQLEQVFADRLEHQPMPPEQSIGNELWQWASMPETERHLISANRTNLAFLANFYLESALSQAQSKSAKSLWCDGCVDLVVTKLDSLSFQIAGAVYWARRGSNSKFYLAPFELEFLFTEVDLPIPRRSIVRFGSANHEGDIVETSIDCPIYRVIQNRPKENGDWAVAIELTPP